MWRCRCSRSFLQPCTSHGSLAWRGTLYNPHLAVVVAKAAAVVPVVPVVVLVVLAGAGAGAGLHHSWCTPLAGTPARTVGNPSHPGLVALALRRSTNCGWPPPPAPASLSLVLQAWLLLLPLVVLVLLMLLLYQ